MADNIKIENPALIAAINALKENDTPATRSRMVTELMRARFIVPATDTGSADGNESKHQFKLALIENKQTGNKLIPAFTDPVEFMKLKVEPRPQALVMDFDALANALLMPKSEGSGLAFDPFGNNIVIDKKNVVSLRMQKQRMKQNTQNNAELHKQTVPPNTTVSLGLPKEPPKPLIDAVSNYLATQPTVTAAYLRLMKQNEDVSLLIIIDGIADGDERIFKGIFTAAGSVIPKNVKLNFVTAVSDFGKKAIENIEPFYSKPASDILS